MKVGEILKRNVFGILSERIESYYNARYFLDIVRGSISRINYELINFQERRNSYVKKKCISNAVRSNRITTMFVVYCSRIDFEDKLRID